MATAALGDELSCSICLNIYTEPVSLRCGHNFCWDCIATVMDTQEGSGVYSCPECREEYRERPTLEKNRKLYNIVNIIEYFRSIQPKTEKIEIFCTYCLDSPVPASKTCLHCETSLCEKHLLAHNKSADHFLTEPTTSFEDSKCPIHKEILKYYCTQDNVCICMSCWVAGDHVGHKMALLKEACENKKEKLKEDRVKLTNGRQGIEMRIQNLENHYIKEEQKAADVTGRITELFSDIRRHLDDEEKKVLSEISRQKEKIVSNLVKELKVQKDNLCKTAYDIDQFLDITDQMTFLSTTLKNDEISIEGDINSDMSKAGCLDVQTIPLELHKALHLFEENVKNLKKSKKFLVTENSNVHLDRNTADSSITLSQDLRSAYHIAHQSLFGNPIPRGNQVLSSCPFLVGKHYWEMDVSRAKEWRIGVAAYNIERKATGPKMPFNINDKCWANARRPQLVRPSVQAMSFNENAWVIGFNDMSWALQFARELKASHNDVHVTIPTDSLVKTVGIYLDYNEGRLSFYQLCGPFRHLHTFKATFTKPLYAAFNLPQIGCISIIP